MNRFEIKSKRLEQSFNLELYRKDNAIVISHSSLDRIFWDLSDEERPDISYEILNLSTLPNIPPMFAVKIKMQKDKFHIERVGEMVYDEWINANEIKHYNPIQICENRAFDKAFLRYLQLEVDSSEVGFIAAQFYSTEEVPIMQCEKIELQMKEVLDKEDLKLKPIVRSVTYNTECSCNVVSTDKGTYFYYPAQDQWRSRNETLCANTDLDMLKVGMNDYLNRNRAV